jgi:hypothetical protein
MLNTRGGSVYAKSAKFDGTGHALTEDEMRKIAPSIFATDAHSSRSERFAPIPTIEVLRQLTKEGFSPVGVLESRARDHEKQTHTKHLIRLRRLDEEAKYRVGDSVVEMLLKNANDGSAGYSLMGGLFRICCLNSLVAHTDTIEDVRIRHTGDVAAKVIEGSYTVLSKVEKVMAAPQDWPKVMLDKPTREAFAEAAHTIRFPRDEEGNTTTPIKAEQFLMPKRVEDNGTDLWTTFNVIQENVLKGGMEGTYRRDNGRQGRRVMRTVNGIDQRINLNRALWGMGEHLFEVAA